VVRYTTSSVQEKGEAEASPRLMINLKKLVIPTSIARRNLMFVWGKKQIPRTFSLAPLAANGSE
jgi:hypothetical protein